MIRTFTKIFTVLTLAALPACGDSSDGLVAESLSAMEHHLATFSSNVGFHHELSHWGLALPGDNKVEWTSDTAANIADVAFVLDAAPLVAAGVDPAALVAKGWIHNEATTGEHATPAMLIKPYDLDATPAGPMAGHEDNAADAFARIVERFPDRVGFHPELDHYALSLPGGDKLEWTKDLASNDADIAFVFVAQELLDAGADVAALEAAGWLHAAATTGEHASPELLIRPFALD
ncbi:hypothetical protein L6R52_20970 [Myxococcota bacterium]|nr:hypothetical protein [Myxococcota bacterium]